jgi:hypothetical protein
MTGRERMLRIFCLRPRAQVTGTKNFAPGWLGLQIAIEHFRRKAEAYLGRQRYNQSTKAK